MQRFKFSNREWGSGINIKLIVRYCYFFMCISSFSLGLLPGNVEAATYELLKSLSSNRANAVPLANSTTSAVGENIYVFVSPQTGISKVSFYLDDPAMSGTPRQVESYAPWDFAGTGTTTTVAKPFNTAPLTAGTHTITAKITLTHI